MRRRIVIPFDERSNVLSTRDYFTYSLDLPTGYLYRCITLVGQLFYPLTGNPTDPTPMGEICVLYGTSPVVREHVNSSIFYNGTRTGPYTVGTTPDDKTNILINPPTQEPIKLLPSCELQKYFGLTTDCRAKSYVTAVNPFQGNNGSAFDLDTPAADLDSADKFKLFSYMNAPTYTFDPYFGYTSQTMGGLDSRRAPVQISVQVPKNTDSQNIPSDVDALLGSSGNIYAICDIETEPKSPMQECITYCTASQPGMDYLDKRQAFNLDIVNMDMVYGLAGFTGKDPIASTTTGINSLGYNYSLTQNGYGLYIYGTQMGMVQSYTDFSRVTVNSLGPESILMDGMTIRDALDMVVNRNSFYTIDDKPSGVYLIAMGKMSYGS